MNRLTARDHQFRLAFRARPPSDAAHKIDEKPRHRWLTGDAHLAPGVPFIVFEPWSIDERRARLRRNVFDGQGVGDGLGNQELKRAHEESVRSLVQSTSKVFEKRRLLVTDHAKRCPPQGAPAGFDPPEEERRIRVDVEAELASLVQELHNAVHGHHW